MLELSQIRVRSNNKGFASMRLLITSSTALFLTSVATFALAGDDTVPQSQRPSATVFQDGCRFYFPIENIGREWKWGVGKENVCEYRWIVTVVVDKVECQIGYTNFNFNPMDRRGSFAELIQAGQADAWLIDPAAKSFSSLRDIRVNRRTTDKGLVIEIVGKDWTEKLFTDDPKTLKFTMGGTLLSESETNGPVEYKRDEPLSRDKEDDVKKEK